MQTIGIAITLVLFGHAKYDGIGRLGTLHDIDCSVASLFCVWICQNEVILCSYVIYIVQHIFIKHTDAKIDMCDMRFIHITLGYVRYIPSYA